MRVIAVIPARMASSRFPGKPMALIHGMPMIGHCYERIRRCPDLTDTYVATCPAEMKDYLNVRVKFREEFRPFAPAVLADFYQDYFEISQESPHMLM